MAKRAKRASGQFSASSGLASNRAGTLTTISTGMIIDLQTVTSIIRDDPAFYNITAYLLCAPLLLYWGFLSIRSPFSPKRAWLALGAIAPLAMLPVYHRLHDAKLLLLAIPACALLWVDKGLHSRVSLALTALAVVFTADLPLALLSTLLKGMHVPGGILGEAVTILLLRPAPLALLLLGTFNLFQYGRACRTEMEDSPTGTPCLTATSHQ